MELNAHILVMVVLTVYTVVLVIVMWRNQRAIRTHHACSDLSGPMARTIASMVDASKGGGELLRAIEESDFANLRVVIFDADQHVLCDTVERARKRPTPPSDTQRGILDAALREDAESKLVHRGGQSFLVHTRGAKCAKAGLHVVTETFA